MKRKLAALAAILFSATTLVACSDPQPIRGIVLDKYIEDFTEYTVVVRENNTNYVHHFTIEADDWNTIQPTGKNTDGSDKYGQGFSSDDVNRPADD